MFPFRDICVDGVTSRPAAGDRFVYDERSGTLFVHRDGEEVSFRPPTSDTPTARLFIGRGWSVDLTRASAELYARLGGLSGAVVRIEGSLPSLQIFEVVA